MKHSHFWSPIQHYNKRKCQSAKVPKCQKCHGGLSASINIKGDLAELVDGLLLALVNDVQILFGHLDARMTKQRRHRLYIRPGIEQIDCETMAGYVTDETW